MSALILGVIQQGCTSEKNFMQTFEETFGNGVVNNVKEGGALSTLYMSCTTRMLPGSCC